MKRERSHNTLSLLAGIAAVVAVTAFTAGCENSVEPFAETTRHFAIYGFLDADADTQFVRIEATRPNLDDDAINASNIAGVTTRNLASGEVISWRDSTLDLEGGRQSLLYWAVFRPTLGDPYRIEVVREDGATSSATTTVPDLTSFDPREPHRTFAATLEQSLVFANVARRPEAVTVNYDVTLEADEDPLRITLGYTFFGVPSPGGWKIDVRLTRDRERINSRLALQPAQILFLHEISMTVRLLSTDWPLVESRDRVNNVVDGFGFFGAAATHVVTWRVDSLIVRQLGFEDKQGEPTSGG